MAFKPPDATPLKILKFLDLQINQRVNWIPENYGNSITNNVEVESELNVFCNNYKIFVFQNLKRIE